MDKEKESNKLKHISGMYENYFLDYASYVILERAVPAIEDGLKPVQRRILHAMKNLDDGRYNKVANIIGFTMQYHPHGDASIGDALVALGQKELLIDTQGNWGNIYTGDSAAAPRYIEARLTKFALEILYSPKVISWKLSYDGRNKEPILLASKFPLLLNQGAEGIAVGLSSKIVPHNFIEITDAAINYLQEKDFNLYPDFPTGGSVDISRYNDGERGGKIRVRAKINKIDKKTISIVELPYGKNTGALIESILSANEKGKIKIKKIDDNTSENVEIIIHLHNNSSIEKTIDALYAFTDCEISISSNCCIIENNKPKFSNVKDILKKSVDNTRNILKKELEIKLKELQDEWHLSSLEKIFIEKRIYRQIEECETWEAVLTTIGKGLEPYKRLFERDITKEDIVKLTEIKIKRISKYNSFSADKKIKSIEEEIAQVKSDIENIIPYTIKWYKSIRAKYGKGKERKTEIRSFENIEASEVAIANQKLYVDYENGLCGYSIRNGQEVCECSELDDIIIFYKSGKYKIIKIPEQLYIGKDILYINVFKRNDNRTIYNVVYEDGRRGPAYIKRCAITAITRDKEYDLTSGNPDSKILYFSANHNGEAERVQVILRPKPRLRKLIFDYDFANIAVKGRSARGNQLSKNEVFTVKLLEKGGSTLGGTKLWYNEETKRVNHDEQGFYLGEFNEEDRIVSFTKSGDAVNFKVNINYHFAEDTIFVEKFSEETIYTLVYFDATKKSHYLKRFQMEKNDRKQEIIPKGGDSYIEKISNEKEGLLNISFKDRKRKNEFIECNNFIAVKGYKAKGKRISTKEIKEISIKRKPDDYESD